MDYAIHILVLICIYSTLAMSLDLLAGHSGQLSLAQGAFFGIGAYATALFALRTGMPIWAATLMAFGVAVVASSIIAYSAMRLYDDYFVIATFCFQMIFLNVVDSLVTVTRGPLGISGIPPVALFGWTATTNADYLFVGLGMAAATWLFVHRLVRSPFGRVLHAMREDDILVRAFGKNDLYFKVIAFAISAVFAAGAGAFYASYISYIDPSSFTIGESILVLAMVIIGGAGSLWGPVVGASILVVLPELLRVLGFPDAIAGNLRQMIYGLLLAVLILVRPQGIFGKLNIMVRTDRRLS
jgi:branched-chain amino acid transport system permease protein